MVKLYRTIKELNKFLLKNNKTIIINDRGLIGGFKNEMMSFDKKKNRRRK